MCTLMMSYWVFHYGLTFVIAVQISLCYITLNFFYYTLLLYVFLMLYNFSDKLLCESFLGKRKQTTTICVVKQDQQVYTSCIFTLNNSAKNVVIWSSFTHSLSWHSMTFFHRKRTHKLYFSFNYNEWLLQLSGFKKDAKA